MVEDVDEEKVDVGSPLATDDISRFGFDVIEGGPETGGSSWKAMICNYFILLIIWQF